MYKYLKKQLIEGGKITRIYATDKLVLECTTDYSDSLEEPEPPKTTWDCKFTYNGCFISMPLGFHAMEARFYEIETQLSTQLDLFEQGVSYG